MSRILHTLLFCVALLLLYFVESARDDFIQAFNGYFPWEQGWWGQHGAHMGPTAPTWALCWPHEHCYLGHCHCVIATVSLRPHFIFNKPEYLNYAWLDIKLTRSRVEYYRDNIHTNGTYRMNGYKYLYISWHKSCFALAKPNTRSVWIGTTWNRTFTI